MLMLTALLFVAVCAAAGVVDAGDRFNGWITSNAFTSSEKCAHHHTLKLQLRSEQSAALEHTFTAVSDPLNPQFRKYLSNPEISELVRPIAGAFAAVNHWLVQTPGEFIVNAGQHNDYLFVSASVCDLQQLLPGHKFVQFIHNNSTVSLFRSLHKFSAHILPQQVQEVVDHIHGVDEFLPVVGDRVSVSASEPGDTVNPTVICKQYDVNEKGGKAFNKHSQGVAAFEDAQFNPSDGMGCCCCCCCCCCCYNGYIVLSVAKFESDYKLSNVVVGVVGPNDGGYFGEASLDTQYISATGNGVQSWFLSQEQVHN